jgi:hypothetical protein
MSSEDAKGELNFQSTRKRMRAVADMLDILARFESTRDREALLVAVVSTASERAGDLMDEQLRQHFERRGR